MIDCRLQYVLQLTNQTGVFQEWLETCLYNRAQTCCIGERSDDHIGHGKCSRKAAQVVQQSIMLSIMRSGGNYVESCSFKAVESVARVLGGRLRAARASQSCSMGLSGHVDVLTAKVPAYEVTRVLRKCMFASQTDHVREAFDLDTNLPKLAAREDLSSAGVAFLFLREQNDKCRSAALMVARGHP
ncbi:hypothetical protein TNCV_1457281 [Trichonephila clavipes]|nr:hypothetical protein TNCV_1457281 [Trichonephila clavipes]